MNWKKVAISGLLGWYLMVPQGSGNVEGICLEDQPVTSAWTVIGSFDLADRCENVLRAVQHSKNPTIVYLHNCVKQFACIASDDPRLAK